MANTITPENPKSILKGVGIAVRTLFRGIGQVMFQESAWTGLLFLAGIFWGSYANGMPQVAWGAVVGIVASTVAGLLMGKNSSLTDGLEGLWGFNGVLVGCAFPTFLGNNWMMWFSLVLCAMVTTWVRKGFNNVMAAWKVNSLTFPFVFMTWMFLFAARYFQSLDPFGLSTPEISVPVAGVLNTDFGNLVVYWLKGISQVFLVDSWVTGIFFLVALFVCSRWAAMWAALSSAIALGIAILFKGDPSTVASGLFGFSPVLTGIALGCTFYKVTWRSALWTLAGVVTTVFVQAAMDTIMLPYGLPTLTGPFCVATWLFLLPRYVLDNRDFPDHSEWVENVENAVKETNEK